MTMLVAPNLDRAKQLIQGAIEDSTIGDEFETSVQTNLKMALEIITAVQKTIRYNVHVIKEAL